MATYTSAASGLWSAGATWVGGVKPPSAAGHKIVIAAAHTVTYDEADGTYGDGTSSTTAANNAIVVNGTLKFSRSTSTILRCAGTLFRASGGTVDAGTTADPIPLGVTTDIYLNHGSTVVGLHVMTSHLQSSGTWALVGVARTRNTTLSASATAGSNVSISVAAADNWQVGDTVVIASDTDDPARAQITTLASGSGTSWTLATLNYNRASGCRVGNLSSNVRVRSASATYPSAAAFSCSDAGTMTLDIKNVLFENLGAAGGWSGASLNIPAFYGVSIRGGGAAKQTLSDCAVLHTGSVPAFSMAAGSVSAYAHEFKNWACYSLHATTGGAYPGDNCSTRITDCVFYRAAIPYTSAYNAGSIDTVVSGGAAWSSATLASLGAGRVEFVNVELHAQGSLVTNNVGSALFDQCPISTTGRVFLQTVYNSPTTVDLTNCTFAGSTLSATNTTGSAPSQVQRANIVAVNADSSDNRVLSYFQTTVTDTSTRKRATYAVKIQPKVANTAIVYTFTLPAVAGVAQTIKGSLRFDSTYGTATPPSIALSGQGVTASFTAPATADAWHDFTLTFTPTSTGDITATVTVQSASTSGFVWLDGIYHYPMTQSVRHFGYQWLPQAAQIVDTRLTLTESAALALPIVVDHGAETITITGSATAREVFEACIADLCQTANQGEAVHISSSTGETFATTYTVVGTVVGPYTDSAGLHVTVTAASLVSGSRVQLYNVTDSTELLNTTLSGAGMSFPTTWSADKTVRLRAEHADYLPLTATGVLTSAGLTFLDAQVADEVYAANGIDGSTVTEFSADGANIQIDVSDPDGVTSVQRLYAWLQHYQTTSAGVASPFFGAMSAADSANYRIDAGLIDLKLDNVAGSPVVIAGGYLYRSDAATVIAAASGSIQMDPGRAYVAQGGTAADVWGYATRTLTADPGATAHATTQSAVAAVPAAVRAELATELARLDVAVSTRATPVTVPTAAQIADTVLGRNLAGGSDGGRTVRDALRASRNKSAISGSTLTVYQEDDATPAWTAAVSTAERDALQSIDPA